MVKIRLRLICAFLVVAFVSTQGAFAQVPEQFPDQSPGSAAAQPSDNPQTDGKSQATKTDNESASVIAADASETDSVKPSGNVTVVDKGTYYEAVLNFENGATHRQIGEEYGKKILEVLPEYEKLLDSYMSEHTHNSKLIYIALVHRINQIRKKVPKDYRDEIEGIASQLSGGTKDTPGDGKISLNELYAINLLTDVARMNSCSAVGVFGSRTADGGTICGRNLDWPDGKDFQLSKLQAVVTFKNGEHSVVSITALGYVGIVTGFSKSHIFAGILDSPVGTKYTASGRRSYTMDLRTALENGKTIEEVAQFMTEPDHLYCFNHIVFLADPTRSEVLENNLSGRGTDVHRALRTKDSELNSDLGWDIPDSIGTVNCFLLKGNVDNHIDPMEKLRWEKKIKASGGKLTLSFTPGNLNNPRLDAMKHELKLLGPVITTDGMKTVMSEHTGNMPDSAYKGDLYNRFTIQSIVYQPGTDNLQIFFHPRNAGLPATPAFENVPVNW